MRGRRRNIASARLLRALCPCQHASECAQRGGFRQNRQLARSRGYSTRIYLCPGRHAHRRRCRCAHQGLRRALVSARRRSAQRSTSGRDRRALSREAGQAALGRDDDAHLHARHLQFKKSRLLPAATSPAAAAATTATTATTTSTTTTTSKTASASTEAASAAATSATSAAPAAPSNLFKSSQRC